MPRAASSTLQDYIFPEISKKTKLPYLGLKRIHKIKTGFISSQEDAMIINFDFDSIEHCFNHLKLKFDKNLIILLVIRKPSDLLNSFYNHSVQKLNFFTEKEFFLNIKSKKKGIDKKKCILNNFNYLKIIKLYKSYFKKVIVVKYEDIQNLEFLNLFDLDKNFKAKLKKKFKKKKFNASLSSVSISILFFLNKFLYLKKISEFSEKYHKKNTNFLMNPLNNLIKLLNVRHLFQYVLDPKIFKKFSKNYILNKKNIPINITKLDAEYKKLNIKNIY